MRTTWLSQSPDFDARACACLAILTLKKRKRVYYILENTCSLGKQYYDLCAFIYEFRKVLYKGAVRRAKSKQTKLKLRKLSWDRR